MPWTRLEPDVVADALQLDHDPGTAADEAAAAQALDHLREQLMTGGYVAIQDHRGQTFIGTLDEAVERMMD